MEFQTLPQYDKKSSLKVPFAWRKSTAMPWLSDWHNEI